MLNNQGVPIIGDLSDPKLPIMGLQVQVAEAANDTKTWSWLLSGCWSHPSEKYEFVSWDDDFSEYMENTCSKPPTRGVIRTYLEK